VKSGRCSSADRAATGVSGGFGASPSQAASTSAAAMTAKARETLAGSRTCFDMAPGSELEQRDGTMDARAEALYVKELGSLSTIPVHASCVWSGVA
jgi:hypothetical protein